MNRGPHVYLRPRVAGGSYPWYYLAYSVRTPGGRRRVRRITDPPTDSKRIATEQLHAALARRTDPARGPIVRAVLEAYRAHLAANAPSTLKRSRHILAWWTEKYGHLGLGALTQEKVNAATGELAGRYADGTVHNFLTILRAAMPREHPLSRLKIAYSSAERHVLWNDDELEKVLGHLPAWARDAVRLLRFTGLRVNELLALRWENIQPRSVRFVQKGKRDDERPLTKRAREILLGIPHVSPWVFPSETMTTPKGYRNLLRLWLVALRRAGIEGKTIHDLRRSFAQDLRRAGASDREIAAALGQTTTRIVGRYTETELDVLLAVAERGARVAQREAENVPDAGRHGADTAAKAGNQSEPEKAAGDVLGFRKPFG